MKSIRVSAVIIHDNGRVYAAQRGYGEYKDFWEFPGGKREEGETGEEAAVREIREELGVTISVERLICTVGYDYPDFHLTMDCYLASVREGEITMKEHENAAWLDRENLRSVPWLPADASILDLVEELSSVF